MRRTPGGTQVPPGTPPQTLDEPRGELPEIPPWPWSKFEQGRSAEEWSGWERRQRELHERDRGVHKLNYGMLGAAGNLHREGCGGGLHRHAGPDRGVHPRWHELCDGEGREGLGSTVGMMESENGKWTAMNGGCAPDDGPGRFQVARLQWLDHLILHWGNPEVLLFQDLLRSHQVGLQYLCLQGLLLSPPAFMMRASSW